MEKMNFAKYKSFLAVCFLAAPLYTSCYDVEDITTRYEPSRAQVEDIYIEPGSCDNVVVVNATIRNVLKVDHFDLYYGIVQNETTPLDTLQSKRLSLAPATRKEATLNVLEKGVSGLDLGATYAFQLNVVDKVGQSLMSETCFRVVPKAQFANPSFYYQGYWDSDRVDAYLCLRLKNPVSGIGTLGAQLADTESDLNDASKVITFSYTGNNLSSVEKIPVEGLQSQHTYCTRLFLTLGEKTYYSGTYFITTN